MKTLDQLLDQYSVSHQNRTNRIIHKFCVPAILFSTMGWLWLIQPFESEYLNGAVLMGALSLIYYARLGTRALFPAIIILAPVFALIVVIESRFESTLPVYVGTFVLGWIGQFIGHHIEGRKPTFLEDIQGLWIAPLWVWYRSSRTTATKTA